MNEKIYNIDVGNEEKIVEYYNELVGEKEVPSNKIFVFVSSRYQSMWWKKKIEADYLFGENISSYFGFVQKELKIFWPLILKKTKLEIANRVEPKFMTFESAQALMGKTVEFFRMKRDFLLEVNISDEELGRVFLVNLLNASLANISYKKIGDYLRLGDGELTKKSEEYYMQVNRVMETYIEKILEKGIVDYATSIYLYNNYLLDDEKYQKNLKKRMKYMIVDSINFSTLAEVKLIEKMRDSLKELIIVNNLDKSFGNSYHSYREIEEKFLSTIEKKIELKKETKFSKELEIIRENILLDENREIENPDLSINLELEYKIDLNKKIIKKINGLIEEGVNPNEITVISSTYDGTLEYALNKIAHRNGTILKVFGRNKKLMDNRLIYSMVNLSILFYKDREIKINFDEFKVLLSVFLKTDVIRASLIARGIYKLVGDYDLVELTDENLKKRLDESLLKRYEKLREFYLSLDRELKIDELIKRIYLEILEESDDKESNLSCKELIDSATNFISVIESFKLIKNPNLEFIKFIRNGAVSAENIYELNSRLKDSYMLLTTPTTYINSRKKSKYIIWSDIRVPVIVVRDKNNLVASEVFIAKKRVSLQEELQEEKENSIAVLSYILKSCENKCYLFGSKYSIKGFEQCSEVYKAIKKA